MIGLTMQARGGSDVIAIINPNNGPSYSNDGTVACFPHLRAAGVTVIGYTATGYGNRPVADIRRDITRWQQAYPGVTGIFFDESTDW